MGSGDAKPLDVTRFQLGEQSSVNRLLVETDQPRLAALLMQPHKIVGLHAPLRASDPMEVSTGAFMDEQTGLNLDSKNRSVLALCIRQFNPFNYRLKWRFDRVPYDSGHELFDRVEPGQRDSEYLMGTVVDPEHEHAPPAVGKGRQLVRERIAVRASDLVSGKTDGLVLEEGIFAKPNLVLKLLLAVKHGSVPGPTADNGARRPRARLPSPDRSLHVWLIPATNRLARSGTALLGSRARAASRHRH